MYKKILLPLDGSEASERALPEAKELVRLTGAELALIRVARARGVVPGTDPTDKQVEAVEAATKYLEVIKADLEKEGLTASVHVHYGHPVEEILNHADNREIDLIVMSTHGRTGLDRWALGSVAEKVIRHAKQPIHLVRANGK